MWIYILASKKNGTLYVGVTNSLSRRVGEHRDGRGSEFASRYGATRLVYAERYDDPAEAIAQEKRFKHWRRSWKVALIERANPDWNDLYRTAHLDCYARSWRPRMKLTWYGHSAFRVDIDGAAILIDPFFTGNPAFEADPAEAAKGVNYIVVTHGHGDHVGDTLDIAEKTGATVITNYDLAMYLASKGLKTFQPMNTGGTVDLGPFSVTLTRADHSAGMGEGGVNVPVGSPNGAILKAKGEKTLWHMGDTDIFSDMALLSEIHGVEACICPIGDRFTMGGKVAALAMTRFVKPKVAIPSHYGSFPIIDQNADAFLAGMQGSGIEVVVPKKGEAFAI